jgi:hypothetical protein
MKFSDFTNLIKVSDEGSNNETYVYFSPQLIRDYGKAVQNGHDTQFINLLRTPEFCRSKSENGIKALGGQNAIKCEAWINSQKHDTCFTHELKINAAARIAFFSLRPLTRGPVILVATHYLEHGLHVDRKEEKSKPHKTANFFAKPAASLHCAAVGHFAHHAGNNRTHTNLAASYNQLSKT